MNIVVLQENLLKFASLAGRGLPSKTTQLPILNNFLLSAKNGEIQLTASDLENTITVLIPGKIEKEGNVLLPAKTLLATLPSFAGEKITILYKDQKATIKGKRSEVELNTEKTEEYPQPPTTKEKSTVSLPGKTIEEIAVKVSIATSHDEARAYLGGILLESRDGLLYAVATDGFRLSLYKKELKSESAVSRMIVPGRVFSDLAHIAKDKENVSLLLFEDGARIGFSAPSVRYMVRLLEGKFPDYQKIIPQKGSTKITASRDELYGAVKLASVFARETSNIVKMKTDKESILVSANSPQTGHNTSIVAAAIEGDGLESAFNFRFLLDLLNASTEDEVCIEVGGALSPGVFTFPKDPSFLHIIMPVRLQEAQ